MLGYYKLFIYSTVGSQVVFSYFASGKWQFSELHISGVSVFFLFQESPGY
jgi:hypothetical protein